MLVSQILRAKGDAVFTVTPEDTVGQVAELLHSRRVGALVVMQGDRVAGIVSERDIVRGVAGGDEKVTSRPVSAYMTEDVADDADSEPGAGDVTCDADMESGADNMKNLMQSWQCTTTKA